MYSLLASEAIREVWMPPTSLPAAAFCTSSISRRKVQKILKDPERRAFMRSMERQKYNYYAVRKGWVPGMYRSWSSANKQVEGFSKCQFKGFKSRRDALKYLNCKDHRDDADAGESIALQTPSLPTRTQTLAPLLVVDGHVGESSGVGGPNVTAAGSSSAVDLGLSSGAAGGNQNNTGKEHFVIKEDKESMLRRVLAENARLKKHIAALKHYINSI
ncbi:hypothetical protein PIB30_053854 [Stylosanthes scabra]|uniref:Ribonuclease H1 N-terminal domain-containing protein n=1 Tax=Stylosanthes scabra TaxID=79078 RepID=A0ABU6XJY4_9FABA|nr:hypothetical protein [Stylosanthes scabra]